MSEDKTVCVMQCLWQVDSNVRLVVSWNVFNRKCCSSGRAFLSTTRMQTERLRRQNQPRNLR